MAIKVKIPRGTRKSSPKRQHKISKFLNWSNPLVKAGVGLGLLVVIVFGVVFSYYWVKYDRIVSRRIKGPLFSNSARIYARPRLVSTGDKLQVSEIVSDLRRAGYSDKGDSPVGSFKLVQGGVDVQPGPASYHNEDGAIIRVANGTVQQIVSTASDGRVLSGYELEPPLLTALDSDERSKRQLVKYADIPKVMVNAVLAIEDRRFFQHNGINYFRLLETAFVDLRSGHLSQGGSTITMQMARGFFLTPQKTFKRKLTEMMIATDLEHKLTKEEIFELYANQVDMGQRGSFSIHGFAEAARAYFNKDLQSITLPEAALLAGLIQRPSYLNPYRHPERALERRNLVLESMVETGAITRDECDKAKAVPLKLAAPNVEASDAPYFVDMVKDALVAKYGEREFSDQAYRVYTTLDPDLQRAAAEAVQEGIGQVDAQLTKLRTKRHRVGTGKEARWETTVAPGPPAQVALIAIDPHTGEVLALVGGRNYGQSQLNHVLAKRPTGSIFKPFVYAAAMNTALTGGPTVWTPASLLDDEQTTFLFDNQVYEPKNYHGEYKGEVSAEYALAHSLNNATIKLAEAIGYDNVVQLAKAAGIKSVQPTPAMAIGAYDATPLDMAGAYTVFANNGIHVSPLMIRAIHNSQGDVLQSYTSTTAPVLDPRVAYVMTSMMEGVVNTGTGFIVRQMGFTAPAAGKTGTSHDAWFAGYTTNLLCIVWVGLDDYTDIRLNGTVAAAPIWADFMKRAVKLPGYRDATDFKQPDGVIDVRLDKTTNRLATPSCPETYTVAFIAGTEPKDTCDQTPGEHQGVLGKIFGWMNPKAPTEAPATNAKQPIHPPQPTQPATSTTVQNAPPPAPPKQEKEKKKGFFGKLAGVFKGDDNKDQSEQSSPK
ncbi:MAG TPA: PBP1A family penicillin-binding protein [Terriglobales bacterium]|nr:PBP1A family penicillin-binding protein [Terriglobales bacterium]